MRFKYCVAILLFVAVVGVMLMAAPAAAAKDDDRVSVDCPGGYVVTFYKAPLKTVSTSNMVSAMSYSTISQGQYNWHPKYINYYTTSVSFYLYWGNPSNSLRLRIFTPEGYALGPLYDPYDGSYNGAVGVTVSRDGGVAQGTWTAEVYGHSVSGTQSYTIS